MTDAADPLTVVWAALGGAPGEPDRLRVTGPPVTLPSTLAVTSAAEYLVDLDAPDGRLTLAAPPGRVSGVGLSRPAPGPAYGAATAVWL